MSETAPAFQGSMQIAKAPAGAIALHIIRGLLIQVASQSKEKDRVSTV